MNWLEVPREQWKEFLGRFSTTHQGWSAAVEIRQPGCIPERLADGEPFHGVGVGGDEGGEGSDGGRSVVIGAGEGGRWTHVIRQPAHVRFARSLYWPDIAVQIAPAAGPVTWLHLWSADRNGAGPGAQE